MYSKNYSKIFISLNCFIYRAATHTFNICTTARIVLEEGTIQNVSAFGNHNFIRARGRNPGCKTGSSIPVSETKIRGSCETAGEVESTRTTISRRQAWSDILNPFANISIRLRIRSTTTMQQENAPRALCRATLICISQLGRKNSDEKNVVIQASTLFFFRKEDVLCKCNNRYRGGKRERFTAREMR